MGEYSRRAAIIPRALTASKQLCACNNIGSGLIPHCQGPVDEPFNDSILTDCSTISGGPNVCITRTYTRSFISQTSLLEEKLVLCTIAANIRISTIDAPKGYTVTSSSCASIRHNDPCHPANSSVHAKYVFIWIAY